MRGTAFILGWGVVLSVAMSASVQAQTHSRTESITYNDNLAAWVLGQVSEQRCLASVPASDACSGGASLTVSYHPTWAVPEERREFGRLVQRLSYDTQSTVASGQRGTVHSVTDGNGGVVTASNWKRGIPQSVQFPPTVEAPAGSIQAAVVNNHGWITQVSDELGSRHCYGYDTMGRITTVTYPSESAAHTCDGSSWTPSTASFAISPAARYGLPAGHWQQAVSTGTNQKITYFDAMWRPVVVETFDGSSTAAGNATRSLVVTRYDARGRVIFRSYPVSVLGDYTAASLAGTHTSYDALDRPIQVASDWEGAGRLTTTTSYLSGFQTRVTNPRGVSTLTRYLAWDEPTQDFPLTIDHAEGRPEAASTDISRDAFGKTLSLVRRNASGSTSLTRGYTYNARQLLCKVEEPETGVTLMGYDEAGNLTWSASGLASQGCSSNGDSSSILARKASRNYDARHRLTSLAFADGRGNQAWTYSATGQPLSISTANSQGGEVVTNSYSYNRRGLLIGEVIGVNGQLWSMGYGYNSLGHAASYSSPSGLLLDYAPNGLGQATRSGGYATAVEYHPNGAIRQFTYGNGLKRTLTQNLRGLPDMACDFAGASCSASAVIRDGYNYDQNGNVLAISDGRSGNRGNRDMAYDGLDRLTQVVSPMFGTANYAYDLLDNLRTLQVSAGPKVRSHSYVYDANNRLTNVTNTAGGATVVGLGYDVQGNLANKNGVQHQFDLGNRLREVVGTESYRYDGHGRRVRAIRDGQNLYSVYGQDGVLRFQREERAGKSTDYVYLGGSLVAQVDNALPLSTPVLTVPSSSTSGVYMVSWTTSPVASRYQLQERLGAAAWVTLHDAAGTSKAVSGKGAGVWGYQVRACSATACGDWSAIKTVSVQLAPTAAPDLNLPATALNGAFTVGWGTVAAADRYELQERQGNSWWATVHDGGGNTKAISGKAEGEWGYQVRACNAAGCGPWSFTATVMVVVPPANVPTLSVQPTNINGGYTVTWSASSGATRYELEERLGNAGWAQIHNAGSTSAVVSGKTTGTWSYRVRGCSDAGCTNWSAIATVAVTRIPASAPVLSVPASNTSGSYTVSWSAVADASNYQLAERLGAGSPVTQHDVAGTGRAFSDKSTGQWQYQVRACNVAGCSDWSAWQAVSVARLPTQVPVLSGPTSMTVGVFPVNWTAVPDAARYELEQIEIRINSIWYKIYDGAGTSSNGGTGQTGDYYFRVRACNAAGCTAWSATHTVTVVLPIPAYIWNPPRVHDSGWDCSASWDMSGGATYYELRRNMVSIVYSGPNAYVSWPGQACASPHDVRACNANGCSGWSPPGYHTGGSDGGIIHRTPTTEEPEGAK